MKRILILFAVCGLGSGILLGQSINIKLGLFAPAMRSDLWDTNIENLRFSRSDMLDAYYSFEYEIFLNRYFSFSLEMGSYNKEVDSEYRDYTDANDQPIMQSISLRLTPIEANIKVYPLGQRYLLSPFCGIGIGVYAWTYQQWGDFINFTDMTISSGFAETKTFSFGLNGRIGLVIRFHPRIALALEGKYQYVQGRLSEYFEEFDLLDLGGLTVNIGINIYFR